VFKIDYNTDPRYENSRSEDPAAVASDVSSDVPTSKLKIGSSGQRYTIQAGKIILFARTVIFVSRDIPQPN
jgi:hypothetical protein